MNDADWHKLGYRFCKYEEPYKRGLWQRKLWQREGHDRSDSEGYLTWTEWRWPDGRVAHSSEGDLDMSEGPMGIRRMTWNPRELTPEIVRMVEAEYRKMANAPEGPQ